MRSAVNGFKMATKEPASYTVATLKEVAKRFGLSTSGTKAELIQRLNGLQTDIWENITECVNASPDQESSENVPSTLEEATPTRNEIPDITRRELELLRREKELLEREIQLLRRESASREASPTSLASSRRTNSNMNINNIAGLLSEFTGADDAFLKWRKQVEMLQRTYFLDDDATKILIGTKLKGKASRWFHSRAEHLELSVPELLDEMREMFDHRPSMLSLRRDFEKRTWLYSEVFADYFHDKVILANRVPIDESEITDYLIDGIPDGRLRNQARMQNFATKVQLLEAFRKITLRPGYQDPSERSRQERKDTVTCRGETSTSGLQRRCTNCFRPGHRPADCPRPRREVGSCFECGSLDHRIKDCPKKKAPKNTANLVQSLSMTEPYQLPVTYTVSDDCGISRAFKIAALVDTGSPVSLIKSRYVPISSRAPVPTEGYDLCGINGSKVVILGLFRQNVCVGSVNTTLSFAVVPDSTMTFDALLGKDFISNSSVKVAFGDAIEVEHVPRENDLPDLAEEILNIDISDNLGELSTELDVNSQIDPNIALKLRRLYTDASRTNVTPTEIDFEMKIHLKHDRPIAYQPRRLAFSDQEKLRTILEKLKSDGVIRPSDSEYASPIVLVRKINGETRLCVDYREINKITVRENFPTPLIEDHLDRLRDKRFFSKLDLKSGFHHVKVSDSSIKYTSFVTPLGQYEYLRMPFGLTNAPRVFQRFTNKIFRPLIEQNKILLYLDDILIATEDIDEHLRILAEVFRLAQEHRLNFRLDKCSFLYTEITYLGYLIDEKGIRPSKEHVDAVANYAIPRTVRQVQQFIGLASYFRRFIPDFSRVAKPLYDIVKSNNFKFGSEENEAFERLRDCLSGQPILAIYSPKLPTELHCDASSNGFGAILLQKQQSGELLPIAYFSRRTTPIESRYHSFELECLAVVYALKRFHVYLSGIQFKILTDCDSFRLTLSKQTINPRISRWAMFLQAYDFVIEHRPGNRMKHVDALSRCNSVLILEGNSFEQVLALKQGQDEEINAIRERLEKGEDRSFELRDGLVYKKVKNDKLLFYVPFRMEGNVIRTCHDDLGHVR